MFFEAPDYHFTRSANAVECRTDVFRQISKSLINIQPSKLNGFPRGGLREAFTSGHTGAMLPAWRPQSAAMQERKQERYTGR